jgi:hypothetical protein
MDNSFVLVLEFLSRYLGKRGAKIAICLVLMSFGLKNAEIKDRFGLSWDSLRKYRTAFAAKNIAPLFELDAERKQSELVNYEDVIMADFEANPPKTLRECRERIIALTGITRSLHRIRVFLIKRGLNPGRLASGPPKQTL